MTVRTALYSSTRRATQRRIYVTSMATPSVHIAYRFPSDFLWGTATSSHQVEGDNTNNDWWSWEQARLGRIFQDQVSGKACEWWTGRAEEDITRMAEMHTNAHRLSVEWSRLEPSPGQWDSASADRYRQILQAMRAAGIRPMITLHHFTNPTWVTEKGGWSHPDCQQWFRRFAGRAAGAFSDLCDLWCTINEPNVYALHGFLKRQCPPCSHDFTEYFRVLRHLLLAHAAAYAAIHEVQATAQVGLAIHLIDLHPRGAWNPIDRSLSRVLDWGFNRVPLEGLGMGRWRPGLGRGANLVSVRNTLDWIGLNYYQRYDVGLSRKTLWGSAVDFRGRQGPEKGPSWWGEFWAYGLRLQIQRLHASLHVPIYITENGVPDPEDRHRPHFILDHLRRVWQTLRFGIPVKGYFFWSLIDNFEWTEAYNPQFRFGLFAVDFQTQQRTPRSSARMYAEIAASGTISSEMALRYAPEALNALLPAEGPGEVQVSEAVQYS